MVLLKGSHEDAVRLREEIGMVVADKLAMTLSMEKTHVTHIDDGFTFLGFRIQRKHRSDGRSVVHTFPSKDSLAAVKRKVKQATGRHTTSQSLEDLLRQVNPVLRGWAAYYRYGVSKRTFSYLGYFARTRVLLWIRKKHPHMTWKQVLRRYDGADGLGEKGVVLYNPQMMQVQRYRFRGAQILTPFHVEEDERVGARFRRTSHDDVAFVGRVSEQIAHRDNGGHVESRMRG